MTTPVVVTRHRCDHCRKSFASRSYAQGHEKDCSRNPANRTCSTCKHFIRRPCCSMPSDECGCKGKNKCLVGAFITWRFNDHDTLDPVPNGWWTHIEDYRRDCPSWTPPTVQNDPKTPESHTQ